MVFPKKALIIALCVIIAAVLVYFFVFRGKSEKSGEESSEASAEGRAIEEASLPVKVDKARIGDLIITLKSPGEAVTNMKVDIKTEVAGVIENLSLEESKHVKKGDLLVGLDDEEYRLRYENAAANRLKYLSDYLVEKRFAEQEASTSTDMEKIQKAKDDYDSARKLYSEGRISRSEFEKASSEYELALIEAGEKKEEILAATKNLTQAEITVKETQLNLEKTMIRAPFSGIIYNIQVSPQEHVTAGQQLFTLVNIDRIYVQARVLESEISKMKVGREADLKFSAYPGKVFKGIIKAISPVIDPQDRTCKVTIDVANPEEEIKPGMHADVEIAAEIHKNRLLIPQEAVLVRMGRKMAFVVEGELAKWRYIDVGLENEDYIEILDGVKDGETVIVDGHFTLAHDAKVRIEQ